MKSLTSVFIKWATFLANQNQGNLGIDIERGGMWLKGVVLYFSAIKHVGIRIVLRSAPLS